MHEHAVNVILTFQVVQQQHQLALSRKADLLASLAFMRNGDATTIQDVSEDPWQSDDCDLFALADGTGKIVALHTTTFEFPVAIAEDLMESEHAAWIDQMAKTIRPAPSPAGASQAGS